MNEQLHAISVYLRVIKEIIIKSRLLNNDYENNCNICEEISRKIVEISRINLSVIGLENIPKDGTSFIASNHRSFFDVFLLIDAIGKTVPFASAIELHKIPFLKEFMEGINCIPIDRYTEDLTKLKQQISAISEHLRNHSLIIFPEGECNYLNDDIREFKKGGFMSINKTETTIIPAYIDIPNVHSLGKWCVPAGDVQIGFGTPFKPTDISEKRVNATLLAQYTQQKVEDMKRVLRQS